MSPGAALLCAGAAAVAVWLLLRPTPSLAGLGTATASATGGVDGAGRGRAVVVPWALVASAGLVPLLGVGGRTLPPTTPVLAVVGVALLLAGRRAVVRARSARARAAARGHLVEACEQLAAELGAGAPTSVALARVARSWPDVAPVSGAVRVGAQVPEAWRSLARRLGAPELHLLAGAWEVSERTGQALAGPVDAVARRLREDAQTRRVVESELASARATARLVAALPLLALLVGSGAGADPWRFLLLSPAGVACLVGGLGLGLAGLSWVAALAEDAG